MLMFLDVNCILSESKHPFQIVLKKFNVLCMLSDGKEIRGIYIRFCSV